jgi:hypothetical protein
MNNWKRAVVIINSTQFFLDKILLLNFGIIINFNLLIPKFFVGYVESVPHSKLNMNYWLKSKFIGIIKLFD